MTTFGYARVSTDGQELDSQLDALKAAGAVKVFKEKESGIKTDRKELARAIAALDKGDVLLVTRLDRLARSTLDLLNTLEQISKRWLPLIGRYLGRYHHATRQADDHHPRRAGGI
jgi:DNA invertase Pin-like site-specific DNA recombinase